MWRQLRGRLDQSIRYAGQFRQASEGRLLARSCLARKAPGPAASLRVRGPCDLISAAL